MNALTVEERIALEQIQAFLVSEEGHSHNGYYSTGWAGTVLRSLLTRIPEESKGNG